MSENERVQLIVTVLDEELQLILPGDGWEYDECKVAKQVSEGMSPSKIEAGLLEGDPDAWLAVLRVSYIRANKEWPGARIGSVDVIALFNRLLELSEEALRKRPPTSGTSNGSAASGASEKLVPESPVSA